MLIINYLIALAIFAIIYFLERLFLLWFKKRPLWPLISFDLLKDGIFYSFISLILLLILHLVFKKIDMVSLLWLDASLYLFNKLIKPHYWFNTIKNKEKIDVTKNHVLGGAIFLFILLECFAFNAPAYSSNKETYSYQSFINEEIISDGTIEQNKIILKNNDAIYIKTNSRDFNDIYLSFNNNDLNLYINIYKKEFDSTEFTFYKYVLIDPKIDTFGYISLDKMNRVDVLKIEFDIDSSRYLNNDTKPNIIVDNISFDAYFPLVINPIRLGLIFSVLTLAANFKSLFKVKEEDETKTLFRRVEKAILFGGILVFTFFIIQALFDNSAYFIKYDDLYLGGTSSNNIYYQQFAAYLKGHLHLDVEVDPKLIALSNPYDPSKREGITYLWDHAFYNGKYYSYYGHAPIYLVMFPIYLVSKYVPSNLFILQFGVLVSVFAFLLAALEIFKLFVKKVNKPIFFITLIAMILGSLLLSNNTYEYGGMVYRIPYAYGNAFLFLTIYLLIKGLNNDKYRFLQLAFAGLSLVFIVLSRPLLIIYLILFIPLVIRTIKSNFSSKKKLMIDYLPMVGVVFVGAILVCVMNFVRFNSIFEFGEHYQLTVNDCRTNKISIEGVLPTLYHYFLQPPKYNASERILSYRLSSEYFDIHPYNTYSVCLAFIPITLLFVLIPFLINKNYEKSLIFFMIASPIVIFVAALISYCFAGVCPRYSLDFAPWASLLGGLIGLKAIEKDNGRHPIVPSLITLVLLASIALSSQYHFIGFDGLQVGDYHGVYAFFKTIFNRYNI